MSYFIFTGLVFIFGMYRAIIKRNRLAVIGLGSLGMILFLVILWGLTNPIRNKAEHVYYKGKEHSVSDFKKNGETVILTLDNNIKVNIDSVTSANPRNAVSFITDWRSKQKF